MYKFYPNQVIDLRFQVDHINPENIQHFEKYKSNPHNDHRNASVFAKLLNHKELKMISEETKFARIKVF